jgi:hypothetical protein
MKWIWCFIFDAIFKLFPQIIVQEFREFHYYDFAKLYNKNFSFNYDIHKVNIMIFHY